MTIKFGALSQAPAGDEEAERLLSLSEDELEASSRGKPMRELSGGAGQPADAPAAGSVAEGAAESVVAADTTKAEDAWVAEGGNPAPDDLPEDQEPKLATDPEADAGEAGTQKGTRSRKEKGLSSLAQLASGKIAKSDVSLKPSSAAQSIMKSAPADRFATEDDLQDLLSGLSGPTLKAGMQEKPSADAAPVQAQQDPSVAPARPAAVGVAAVPAAAQTVGDVVGQGIAGVVAAPFLAMTSAHRHLRQRFSTQPTAEKTAGANASAGLSAGVPLAALARLEKISTWKCDQIEKSANAVLAAADGLRGVDGFVVWEDGVTKEANKRGVSPSEVIVQMRHDADLAPLREQMTALWRDNPAAVAAYRRESDVFEKHLKDVREKFANSDETVRSRVTEAMKGVETQTSDLPGFGTNEGEYTATLGERVREMARAMIALLEALVARLTGKAPADSAPEISG
ncbi:hypothetical protein [Burkholderia arboris]|uniref:hypothetical protein n=1 Tax=Burkholderia arboris TaxID=488730 RepID=UPI001CF32FF6|nr:hypothetical protein [Burkholderia arboris]MCA8050880.1 hypothetical protein [Burkholderia arboris]HEP6430605.1 hypothetical protein [Burkholderia cenocepacia]